LYDSGAAVSARRAIDVASSYGLAHTESPSSSHSGIIDGNGVLENDESESSLGLRSSGEMSLHAVANDIAAWCDVDIVRLRRLLVHRWLAHGKGLIGNAAGSESEGPRGNELPVLTNCESFLGTSSPDYGDTGHTQQTLALWADSVFASSKDELCDSEEQENDLRVAYVLTATVPGDPSAPDKEISQAITFLINFAFQKSTVKVSSRLQVLQSLIDDRLAFVLDAVHYECYHCWQPLRKWKLKPRLAV
jgi:hypothetical protein